MDETEENETTMLSVGDENDGAADLPSSSNLRTHGEVFPPKNKRKRTDVRKKIRKILSPEDLDVETLSAQKEEEERLHRLELQKSLNASGSAPVGGVQEQQVRGTPPLSGSPLDMTIRRSLDSPVLVDITCPEKLDAVIVIDDSDDEYDIVETSQPVSSSVIEISDSGSDSEQDVSDVDDKEPETSGSHTNDDVNQPNVEGRVLVNVNHPPTEPDIFLSPYLSHCVKPHQIGGIRFLYDNLVESLSRFQTSPGFGCILAHSMGLGKTLQIICFVDLFLTYTKATKVLCIVPMNTIQNWYSEFNTWLPEESPDEKTGEDSGECSSEDTDGQVESSPSKRKFKVFMLSDSVKTTVARSTLISKWHEGGGVLLMGYEMYRILAMYSPSLVNNSKLTSSKRKKPSSTTAEVIDLEEEEKNMDLLIEVQQALCKPGPDLVVCDEGHRIKNNQANIYQALKRIQTRRRVVLTGYPLQNNLLEYWCMVDFVRPNFLGTKHEFSNMFERPIVNGQCVDSTAGDIKLMRFRAHVLHSLLEGFVQRRSEAVLRKTLPEKEEYVIPVKMSSIQLGLYRSFVSSVKNYVGFVNPIKAFSFCIKIWNHPDILKSYLDRAKDGGRNDSPLTVGDPDLDIGETVNKKSKEKALDMTQRIASQEVSLVPPEVKVNLASNTDWVGKLFDNYEFGVMENGTKMVILSEIIEKTVSVGDKILVFSQSLSTLTMIEDFLRKRVVPPHPTQLIFQPVHWERNKNYYRLDGSTSSQEREKLIRAFNSKNNQSVFVFLLSTRACSLGVNLVGANRVVVFDASWNPCHDAQAVCRVYRYGQTKKCFIYRLVSYGTFEKRIYERQITKEGMSDRVIDELNPEANLTKQEAMNLFNDAECEIQETKPSISSIADRFLDPVLNHVCDMLRKSLSHVPFKHKVPTSQKSKTSLTKAEKREAKKGYEREKRAIDSAGKCAPISGSTSALIRERMRREAVHRPIGHVKPIQNVQPSASIASRLPAVSLPAALPPQGNTSLGNMPSMAYLSSLSLPSLSYGRYYPPGELRTFPPYAFEPSPAQVQNSERKRSPGGYPLLVSLIGSGNGDARNNVPPSNSQLKDVRPAACTGRNDGAAVASKRTVVFSSGTDITNPVVIDETVASPRSANPTTPGENSTSSSIPTEVNESSIRCRSSLEHEVQKVDENRPLSTELDMESDAQMKSDASEI